MLKLGLGRAYLLIKEHYTPAYRDTILHACLHNLAYDRQIEGTRGWYMFHIIQATPEFAFYRDAIRDALIHLTPAENHDDYDIQQVYSLAAFIAEAGDLEMRATILQKFRAEPALGDFAGAQEIIALDGLDGFIYVAEFLSEQIRLHGEDFIAGADIHLFFVLQGQIGETEAAAAMDKLRTERPAITPVLDAIDVWRKRPKSDYKPQPRLAYDQLKQRIQNLPDEKFGITAGRNWAEQATDEELGQAAQDFLLETDPRRLKRYLGIFWKRPFPLDPTPIFTVAQSQDERLAISAINALEQIDHPAVRAFALESIERGWMVGRVVSLLQGSNYQESDWAIIEPLTRQVHDEDDYHRLGFGVREILDQHPTPLAIPSLVNLFQIGPCGFCREAFVDYLGKFNAIPDWLYAEARYDSNYDVRELIAKTDPL